MLVEELSQIKLLNCLYFLCINIYPVYKAFFQILMGEIGFKFTISYHCRFNLFKKYHKIKLPLGPPRIPPGPRNFLKIEDQWNDQSKKLYNFNLMFIQETECVFYNPPLSTSSNEIRNTFLVHNPSLKLTIKNVALEIESQFDTRILSILSCVY